MSKSFSAKKYFLYGFKKSIANDNKNLSKRFLPSIRELIYDYNEIYDDISHYGENVKLSNSKKELIESIVFFIKENILYRQGVFKEELDFIISDFIGINNQAVNKHEEIRLYNRCKSMVKKINNNNVYSIISNIVKQLENFDEIDRAIDALISELLYDGYSLKYIDSWFNENIGIGKLNEENINEFIDIFSTLKSNKKDLKYYLNIHNKKHHLKEKIYLDYNMVINKVDYEKLVLIDNSKKDIKSYLQYNKDSDIYCIKIEAMDYYKGLEVVIDSINSYFQMINCLDEDNVITIGEKIIVRNYDGTMQKLRKENYDDKILFYMTEKREKLDIKDFIRYRDKVYTNHIGFDEISNIQRTINIIKGQKEQTKENRLINLWSVLEYMLTFYGGNSIISKVKDVIPKVTCLYIFKDKLNVFWSNLFRLKNSGHALVEEFIVACKKDTDDYEYDLNKLLKFISDKGEVLIKDFEFNDVLKRNIAEIGMLLFKNKNRLEYIEKRHEEIKHDLVRIYRARNIIIHSGRRDIKNINYKTLRLYQYNNNLLGVIIYYKKNNPYLTIEEILNSINITYEKYLKLIKGNLKNEELIELCRPKYLFIE